MFVCTYICKYKRYLGLTQETARHRYRQTACTARYEFYFIYIYVCVCVCMPHVCIHIYRERERAPRTARCKPRLLMYAFPYRTSKILTTILCMYI